MVSILFDAINDAALARLSSLLHDWFPNGKRAGHEWCVGSIDGEAGESFKVNMQTGKWAEFNGRGETGGDVIGLYAAKFCRGDRVKAALDLAGKFGIKIKQRAREWIPLISPPADAGPLPDAMLSSFDALHRYTSLEGRETHFVGRIEARGDKDKQFIPVTYGELKGVRGWHKKAPSPPRPLYGLRKLTANPDAPVILCEGEKAADAAQRLFANHACMSWFGGTGQVEHADLSPLVNRSVIVWPDADESGRNAMRKLIPRLPTDTQVVRTDGLPEKFDAADLEREGCDDPAAWLNERLTPARDPTGVILPDRFSFDDQGLWHQPLPRANSDTEPMPVWVCGLLHVDAETCDDTSDNHGLLMHFTDRAGHEHTWAMPREMVHADGGAIAMELERTGLPCGTSPAQHALLKRFLGAVTAERRVRCVNRAGWHDTSYVLPNRRVFGADPESIVLQTEYVVMTSAYAERGTLDGWRNNIACYAVGNDLMALSMSAAFAAPLLKILNEPSGGVHFYGDSRTGKTTAAERCAMSVYGPGDNEHMRTWRATANGLEAAAVETNDGLLPLDELSQANPREAGQVVYTLANGVGKTRANRAGGARPVRSWCAFFISTGEVTLEQKLAEAGLHTRAGQDVRMIELPADAEAGNGVWQNLHGFPNGAALSDHLSAAASADCYGTAGPAYLDQLARDRADDPELLVSMLHGLRKEFLDAAHTPSDADGQALIPANADGQVLSVAGRLASIAAAGELAIAYGVLPWPEGEAQRAGIAGLKRWLKARGGTGAGEDVRAVEKVRAFIAAYGSSRFELVNDPDQPIIPKRAGWKVRTTEGSGYLITPSCWKDEVCSGLNPQNAADAVDEAGFLVRGNKGRRTFQLRIPPYGPVRGYLVRDTILGDDEGEDDGGNDDGE
jgi:uncharacterized protein (DUF927 family)